MRRLVALAVLGVVLLVGSVASASPTDPIVGTWAYGEGRVVVRGSGTSFTATVTAATRFAVCTHARGEQMWTIAHPGRWYSGRHLSFDDRIPGCDADDRVWLPAAWSVEGNRLTVRIARVTHDYEEAADVKVRLRVRGKGALGPEGTASLTVAVASSSSPFCFVGEEGTLVLSRGRAILSVCGDNLQFVHGRPAGTAVTVAIRLRT